jgi:outer membrane biosynthesis protein TonB
MNEGSWSKMFAVALLLHIFMLAAFTFTIRKPAKRIDLPYYSVNLVTEGGGGSLAQATGKGAAVAPSAPIPKAKREPLKKRNEPDKSKKVKAVPAPKTKEQPVASTKERSLAPKVKNTREISSTTEEVESLDDKIRQMKKRQQYFDVVGASRDTATPKGQGSSGTQPGVGSGSGIGSGSGSVEGRYASEVWDRIQEAWSVPTMLANKRDLQSKVTIKIRKDGRIVEWTFDERSTSRVYDESIARALKSIDRVPPIPSSMGTDDIEISFRVLPPRR